MNTRLITLPLLFAALTSCDKIKDLTNKVKGAINKSQIAQKIPLDPELQKLVDQTAEGAIFRKDLPFPQHLEVKSTRETEVSIRNVQSSAIEKSAETVKGVQTTTRTFTRSGHQVTFTVEPPSAVIPKLDPKEIGKKVIEEPVKQVAPAPKSSITFELTNKGWKVDHAGDFKSVVLSKELSPVFEQLLQDNALSPRPLWFGKKRMKPGDSLVVSGDSLVMLFAGKVKGSVSLKLEAFEAVDGHPCGVFSITGNYSRVKTPNFDATFTDEEVAIQSGKLWLSLIYPIVLKQELDTIHNTNAGGQGGLVSRSQGSAKISQIYSWKSRTSEATR